MLPVILDVTVASEIIPEINSKATVNNNTKTSTLLNKSPPVLSYEHTFLPAARYTPHYIHVTSNYRFMGIPD